MLKKLMLGALGAAALAATPAMAAIQQVNGNGILTGATGVLINGASYTVTFTDGTCASVYGACQTSNFDFTNQADATAAARALIDQVFLDTAQGYFDSDPTKTFGCGEVTVCVTNIAFSTSTNNVARAFNYYGNSPDLVVGATEQIPLFDTALSPTHNYARFTPTSAGAVPEPAIWAMMILGFGAIGRVMRRRERAVFA